MHGFTFAAFAVDDVDSAFAFIKDIGVQTTSEHVTTDMLSGLKQFFILPCHAGFFIELIERPTNNNVGDGKEEENGDDTNTGEYVGGRTPVIYY